MVDAHSLLTCVGQLPEFHRYFAYGASSTGIMAATEVTKRDPSIDFHPSTIAQMLLSRAPDGTPRFLAYNEVTGSEVANEAGSRTLLLVNFNAKKFILRRRWGTSVVAAAGQGGITPAGLWEPGFWLGRGEISSLQCIDNPTRTLADATSCDAVAATWTSKADVASYLELSADGATAADAYLARFTAGATVGDFQDAEMPQGGADLINFPDQIR
jgi:hypothetical protein